jgi:tRNA (adenine57-N1/adenine58-N1)-methyltransferase
MFREGELVYLLDDQGRRYWVNLRGGMIRVSGLGVLDGDRMMELDSGDIHEVGGSRFIIMRPGVPELMDSLERGAQIITPKDAETIVFRLSLGCGQTVLEGGVGSGALTLALLNAVGERGKVISVELRDDFAKAASRNVERAGLPGEWELVRGDVREMEMEGRVDAAVLDIPDPWNALDSLRKAIRPGGRLCAYIPNVNQLETTVRSMREAGLVEVHAMENIQRNMEVHEGGVRPSFEMLGHTGYLAFGRVSIMQKSE